MSIRMARWQIPLAALLLAACAPAPDSSRTVEPAPVVGGDQDAHGCKASAGYSWCEHTGRCERPWELARERQFSLDRDGFKTFCSQPKP